jgi:uncharacterized OsmC-like protein
MEQEHIGKAFRGLRNRLQSHPEYGACTDSYALATLGQGLRIEVTGPTGQLILTDMAKGLGGGAAAPSPAWYMRAAASACTATVIALRAAELGIALDKLAVNFFSRSDSCGMLGVGAGIPAGPLNVSMEVQISAHGIDADELKDLVSWAIEHSPVADAVQRAVPMEVVVAVN